MRLLSIVSAAALAVAAIGVTSDAFAQRNRGQAATGVVVNYQRVLTESAIGRDMSAKLQQVHTQISTDAQALAPERQSIEQERQRLAAATRNQSAEQINNNPQVQALAQRQQQLQQRAASLQGDLECSQLIALRDLRNQISPTIRSVMQSRGAGYAVDSANVIEALPEFDITSTVIQQLDANQATRTLNVSRHAVTECQGQQPAAGQ
jgi:Skp family chaperone for outer membrane proteins